MIVGEMRDMHTEKGLNAVENLLATLDGNQSVTQREYALATCCTQYTPTPHVLLAVI